MTADRGGGGPAHLRATAAVNCALRCRRASGLFFFLHSRRCRDRLMVRFRTRCHLDARSVPDAISMFNSTAVRRCVIENAGFRVSRPTPQRRRGEPSGIRADERGSFVCVQMTPRSPPKRVSKRSEKDVSIFRSDNDERAPGMESTPARRRVDSPRLRDFFRVGTVAPIGKKRNGRSVCDPFLSPKSVDT